MKFKLVEDVNEPLLEAGLGRWWKNKGLGKHYGFNEDDYVVHHINGEHSEQTREDGSTNLSLIPSKLHNRFKKANEAEWEKIESNYEIVEVQVEGRTFLLALPKSTPQPSSSNKKADKELAGAGV